MKVLTAFYDLAIGPVSFDFVPFLVRAKMEAGDRRLHVVIVPDPKGLGGMFRDKSNLYDVHEMRWRLWNLVIPACGLADASVTLATDWEQARTLATGEVWPPDWDRQSLKAKRYVPRVVLDAAKAGRAVHRLHASPHALRCVGEYFGSKGKPVVTITSRNTYEPGRNTSRSFAELADALVPRYSVVPIEDTVDELRRGFGFGGINLDLRMACYQLAHTNIIGNHGPAQLLWFSDSKFLQFNAAMPFKDWKRFWIDHIGVNVDACEQLPWATPHQRFVYGPPSVDVLREYLQAL